MVLDFTQHNWGSFSLEHRYLYDASKYVCSLPHCARLPPGSRARLLVLAQENVSDPSVAGVLWMLADNQGTVRDLVDGSGQFVAHNTYDAFGTPVGSAMINNLTRYFFTGRDYDRATQLQYNRERWYDPATGKFLTEDPIGFAGGDSKCKT